MKCKLSAASLWDFSPIFSLPLYCVRLSAVLPFPHSIHTVCGGCSGVGSGPTIAEGIGRRRHSTTHSLGGQQKARSERVEDI